MKKSKETNTGISEQGFTLVELLVSIAIFSVIISITVGGFISGLRTNRQAVALMAANGNASVAIEQAARELRTGSVFDISGAAPCPPSPSICFENANGEYVQYAYDSASGSVVRNGTKLTDDNVNVRYLNFRIIDVIDYSKRIIINLGISARESGVDAGIINIQTTVSARNPGA